MLTFVNAVTIAQMELNKIQCFGNLYTLLSENATETPYGWLIPWAQSDFRGTKEVTLGGNAPFFVDRLTGEVSRVAGGFQEWVEKYAKKHRHGIDNACSDHTA